MIFGDAIQAVKAGKRAARAGWNGKGMFIYLNRGIFDPEPFAGLPAPPAAIDGIPADLFNYGVPGTITRLPNINMRSASGTTVTGWLASQTDLLAEDWDVVPEPDEAALFDQMRKVYGAKDGD